MTCVLPCFLLFPRCSMPNWVGKVGTLGSQDAHRSASREQDSPTKQSLRQCKGRRGLEAWSRGPTEHTRGWHPCCLPGLALQPAPMPCFLFYTTVPCNSGPRHCAARPLSLALCTDLSSHPAPAAQSELFDHGRRPGVFFLSFLLPLLFRILDSGFWILGCIRLFWGHRGHDDTVVHDPRCISKRPALNVTHPCHHHKPQPRG